MSSYLFFLRHFSSRILCISCRLPNRSYSRYLHQRVANVKREEYRTNQQSMHVAIGIVVLKSSMPWKKWSAFIWNRSYSRYLHQRVANVKREEHRTNQQSMHVAIGIFVLKLSTPWKKMERIYLKHIIFSLPAPNACQSKKWRISDEPPINVNCNWDICIYLY